MESPVEATPLRSDLILSLAKKAKANIDTKEVGLEELKTLRALWGSLMKRADWPSDYLTGEVITTEKDQAAFLSITHKKSWYSNSGPFKPVRLLATASGKWKLLLNLVDVVEEGKFDYEDSTFEDGVITLVKTKMSKSHVLCPGLGDEKYKNLEKQLGYFPKSLQIVRSPTDIVCSKACELWFVPAGLKRSDLYDNTSCTSCYKEKKRIELRLEKLSELTPAQRRKRQSDESHLPLKYLSPRSKKARLACYKHFAKLGKAASKYRKKTTVTLSSEQSDEMAKLYDSITKESKELKKIELEANHHGAMKVKGNIDVQRGAMLREVWNQEKQEILRDQQNNATGKRGNRWSISTLRIALAIYTRSPAAFRAVRGLSILSLPCENVLRKIIKSGSENAGIDYRYLKKQKEKYQEYCEKRSLESGCLPPLQLGSLIFDEVKVQMKVAYNTKSCEIKGYVMTPENLSTLHDVFSSFENEADCKTNYILQYLWKDLTSPYDLLGPYFTSSKSTNASFILEQTTLTMESLALFGFRTLALVCDGASSNVSALKMLCGHPNKALSSNADTLEDDSYYITAHFKNPFSVDDIPVFVVICPTHQLKNMISALASSKEGGSKSFLSEDIGFGWESIKVIYNADLERAKSNLARLVPGLKYSYIERDNWTKLNVTPAKIMQQRYMIAALRTTADQTRQRNQRQQLEKTAQFLEACNLIFERGILSHKLIKSSDSIVVDNIKKGFNFFQDWCYSHSQTVYEPDNSKRSRSRRFLAWQTWDLLRIMVSGFLQLCDWYTDHLPGYYVCPLRVNGSSLESIFSILKYGSGGNLSALTYGPMLGRLISNKGLKLERNVYSEKGYRDGVLVTDHGTSSQTSHNISIPHIDGLQSSFAPEVTEYLFPANICQSTLGGRTGSNACTVISILCGYYFIKYALSINPDSVTELDDQWCVLMMDAISEGNRVHDFVYAGAPVNIDVEDAAQIFGADIHLQSIDESENFFLTDDQSDLTTRIQNKQMQNTSKVGIMIANGETTCICIDRQGNLAVCDSHKHGQYGSIILKARNTETCDFVDVILKTYQHYHNNRSILYGCLTWVSFDQ